MELRPAKPKFREVQRGCGNLRQMMIRNEAAMMEKHVPLAYDTILDAQDGFHAKT